LHLEVAVRQPVLTQEEIVFLHGWRTSNVSITEAVVQRIAICYPTESLSGQVAQWAQGHEDCRVETVRSRSAMAIRGALGDAQLALVDASDDHAQAIDLFSQAVARLGARRASVYTERMHDGLEDFVRTQGAWLLLGPLTDQEWDDYFATMLPATRSNADRRHSSWRKAA
jgi:hypothetical protein